LILTKKEIAMKRRIIIGLICGLFTTVAWAGPNQPVSVGFSAYSSATPMTCHLLAGTWTPSGMNPNTSYTTSISLGTKGSGTYTIGKDDKDLMIACFPTVAGPSTTTTTKIPVKMYFNGDSTYPKPITDINLNVR
jgi:hypothetical protein